MNLGRQKGTETLRLAVKRLDARLWHKLEEVWRRAEQGVHDAQRSKVGHQQGTPHCSAVEQNLVAIIPDDWKGTRFDVWNLFVFSAAAALHDLGKASDAKDDHGFISMTELRTRAKDFGLDDTEAEVIGWVVRPHNDGNFDELPERPIPIGTIDVNVRQLAAIFKLADALHTDLSRVSRQVTAMGGRRPEDNPKTLFRMRIRGWRFDEQNRIELYGVPKDWNETKILSHGVELTRRELETASPILRELGIPCEIVLRIDDTDLKGKAVTTIREQRNLKRAWLGLEYFLEEDAQHFKGRDDDAGELWKSVMGAPLWLLIGDSGVGKTSLIHAGLLPHIHRMGWKSVYARPFDQPDRHIIAALADEFLKKKPADGTPMVDVLAEAAQSIGDRSMLLILDQFEDVLRSGSSAALDGIRQALVAVQAGRFRNVHVLVSYRSDAEATLGPLFQKVTGSNRGAPKGYLSPLNLDGAKEALKTGFATAQVGVEQKLLDVVCRDLATETTGRGIYPPYIQMLGETLSEVARQKGNGILTEALYVAEGSAKQIIGQYLFRQLDSIGSNAAAARQVLVALVRSTGTKGQRSVEELKAETHLDDVPLTEILAQLVDRRMIRHLAGQQYEIAHDYLAQLVDRNIVSEDQRRLMAMRELLEMKARAYPVDRALLHSDEMAQIYVWRDKIMPNESQIDLLLDSALAGNGPAWVWLNKLGKAQFVTLLKDRTKHELAIVRKQTAELLASLAGDEAVAELKYLLSDRSNSVRLAAAKGLVLVAGANNVADLIPLLKLSESEARTAAANKVAQLAGPQDIPELTTLLKSHSSIVRRTVAAVLAYVAARQGVSNLKELLNHKNRSVRSAAVFEFSRIDKEKAIPELKDMLHDRSLGVRSNAVTALAKVAGREAIPKLKDLLKDDKDEVKRAAHSAILKLVDHEEVPVLIQMIGTGRYDYDWEAQRALERLMERDDIPRLLEHNNPNVRQAAVSALGRIAGRQAISKLLTIMEQEKKIKDSQVYRVACNAFLSVASRDEMPTILALIKDEGYHTGAVGVFARLANRQEISDLLRSGGKRVREALLQALRRVPNREAIPVLKNLFKNPDRYVRRAAVEAFSTVANQQDIPDIKALFQDRSSTVRDSAEKALAAAIKGLGINELNNLKKDENQTLRRVAAKQLAREDGHKDVSVLLDACGDPGSDVRQASAQGLLKISKIDDLTSIAQRAARYSATGTGREVLSVLLLLDRKFFAPTELKQGEEDQRRSLWQLGYRSE